MSNQQRQAAIGVIVRAQKFLMITRAETELAPGMICFPGGGVEEGEFVDQAVVREMDEELNVVVAPVRELWRSHSARGTELCWWLVNLSADQVIIPNKLEVASFEWMCVEQISGLENLLESNANFFAAMHSGEFSVH